MKFLLHFQMLGYWHPGTGRGQGPGADAEVNRTPGGLPFLPGRTVKGLLLEAATQAGVSAEERERCFGSAIIGAEGGLEAARFETKPGALRFESARIGQSEASCAQWEAWAVRAKEGTDTGKPDTSKPDDSEIIGQLYRIFASTKLDESGVAADGTLRSVEVAVPTNLLAVVEAPRADGALAMKMLRAAAPFVNAVGAHRTRGLGRCVLTVQETA